MSDGRIWFLWTGEGQKGPYTAAEILAWKQQGHITDEWHVWREGLAGWQKIGDTPELNAVSPMHTEAIPQKPAGKEKILNTSEKQEVPMTSSPGGYESTTNEEMMMFSALRKTAFLSIAFGVIYVFLRRFQTYQPNDEELHSFFNLAPILTSPFVGFIFIILGMSTLFVRNTQMFLGLGVAWFFIAILNLVWTLLPMGMFSIVIPLLEIMVGLWCMSWYFGFEDLYHEWVLEWFTDWYRSLWR